jgi:hypothetical protein
MEEKVILIDATCKHCGNICQIDYIDFLLSMRANHFYRMTCYAEGCGKQTLITYPHITVAIERGQKPEEVLSTIKINDYVKKEETK